MNTYPSIAPITLAAIAIVLVTVAFVLRRSRAQQTLVARQLREFSIVEAAWRDLIAFEYIAHSEAREWVELHSQGYHIAKNPNDLSLLPTATKDQYQAWCKRLQFLPDTIKVHNERFLKIRFAEEQVTFDRATRGSLTAAQRKAICVNENVTLVLAGAGTGKTETIISKIDYLIRRELAQPKEILAVSFTNEATNELKGRLRDASKDAQVSTLHALARHIVGAAEVRQPSVSSLAESDGRPRREFVRTTLINFLQGDEIQLILRQFYSEDRAKVSNIFDPDIIPFEETWTYFDDPLVAINGRELKSKQEVMIANWLTLSGILWEYEATYASVEPSAEKGQYRPDFYLPEYDIYIEHFGINRDGSTAMHIDNQAYLASMEWKRAQHAQFGSDLIETFSYQSTEGNLISFLEQELQKRGVEPQPLTLPQIEELFEEANRPFAKFVIILAQYISVFKGSGKTRSEVQKRTRSKRDEHFLMIFWRVLEKYNQELVAAKQVDFDDLINLATHHSASGASNSHFHYIIVDEFQDMSETKLRLVLALLSRQRHARLFVVGDDWQSIYRFSGSDVGIITQLGSRLGPHARIDLDTTFRFSQEMVDVTSRFIQQSDSQLKKAITSHSGLSGSQPLALVYDDNDDEPWSSLILEDILKTSKKVNPTVLFLGRYWRAKPKAFEEMQRAWKVQGVSATYLTVHGSKGKEADFVIIAGLKSGNFAFPSTIPDDPVMNMVLMNEETLEYAEERRLLYVAMTRARVCTYLLVPSENVSTFVQNDLMHSALSTYVRVMNHPSQAYMCPKCNQQSIRRRKTMYGNYWSCHRYPLCDGRLATCHKCGEGAIVSAVDSAGQLFHECTVCGKRPDPCPLCKIGYLQFIKGNFGDFYGCSTYNRGSGCRFKYRLSPNSTSPTSNSSGSQAELKSEPRPRST